MRTSTNFHTMRSNTYTDIYHACPGWELLGIITSMLEYQTNTTGLDHYAVISALANACTLLIPSTTRCHRHLTLSGLHRVSAARAYIRHDYHHLLDALEVPHSLVDIHYPPFSQATLRPQNLGAHVLLIRPSAMSNSEEKEKPKVGVCYFIYPTASNSTGTLLYLGFWGGYQLT